MTLSLDEFRRLEHLLTFEPSGTLSPAEEDEIRQLVSREDANATMLPWMDLISFAYALVKNRGFVS